MYARQVKVIPPYAHRHVKEEHIIVEDSMLMKIIIYETQHPSQTWLPVEKDTFYAYLFIYMYFLI